MKRTVMHLIYSLFHGGAERLIETYLLTSDRDRFETVVCSLTGGGDLAGRLERAGARVILLAKRRRGDPRALLQLTRILRSQAIDILHLHNTPAVIWGTTAAILSGRDVPIVITEHRPYIPRHLPFAYRALYPSLIARARKVIFVSEHARTSFTKRFPGPADRFVTVFNGIRTEPFENLPPKVKCRNRFGLPAGAPIVGAVGRLVPVKNHAALIDAFRLVLGKVHGARLAIVGTGELEQALRSRASSLGMQDAVSIIAPAADIELFFGAIDVFVLSSLSEGLPLTLLEAFAAGLPAVATNVGGIPEVIDHGRSGYLVSPGSAAELAERIVGLLADPGSAASMGEYGRQKVRRLFTAESMIGTIHGIYDEVLEGTHGS